MIQTIGVLTSGGDSPGMNAAIRAVVKVGHKKGMRVFGIYDGYKGLIEDHMIELSDAQVSGIESHGGTILGSARLPEFKELEVQKKAVEILHKRGIQALVVIGGDGSYMGAQKLTNLGINCVGIPGTIDNDISSTDYTLGFDTAMNTITYCIDHLRDTSSSHHRCSVIEVMGNRCGDLTLMSGIGNGANLIVTPDHLMTYDQMVDEINYFHDVVGRKQVIVLIAEKMPEVNVQEAARIITEKTPYQAKWEILGRIQRGGAPSAFDRYLGASMGAYAVDRLAEGMGGIAVSIRNNSYTHFPIMEALSMKRPSREGIHQLIDLLK